MGTRLFQLKSEFLQLFRLLVALSLKPLNLLLQSYLLSVVLVLKPIELLLDLDSVFSTSSQIFVAISEEQILAGLFPQFSHFNFLLLKLDLGFLKLLLKCFHLCNPQFQLLLQDVDFLQPIKDNTPKFEVLLLTIDSLLKFQLFPRQ